MISNFGNSSDHKLQGQGPSATGDQKLPMLPIRDLVVYPYMILPLLVGRDASIQAVEEAMEKHDRLIVLASQKDIQAERPQLDEIYDIGTVAMIMRMRRLPDGRVKILVQGLQKVKISDHELAGQYYRVSIDRIATASKTVDVVQSQALIKSVRDKLEKLMKLGKPVSPDILMVLDDLEDPSRVADLVASNLGLPVTDGQMVLECNDPIEKLYLVDQLVQRDISIIETQMKLGLKQQHQFSHAMGKDGKSDSANNGGANQRRDPFNQGSSPDEDFGELKQKIQAKKLPSEALKEVVKQVQRLEKMHPDSSEANILRNYLDWVIDLPWSEVKQENLDLDHALSVLDDDHFDLKQVKDRILDYLAVRKLKNQQAEANISTTPFKSPILCFAGPPGVGKTSLGRSIAKATGRSFVRISLGGVKDEAEIRGHRRTYVGAMPGRFIQAMKQAKSLNPVIILDEIDKIGSDYKGDPSSALLEVLDLEQNSTFRDHYLGIPYDLSQVMFIATANVLENIPSALRDRMEIIMLPGYGQEEKLMISKKFLVPKQMDENGVGPEHVEITDSALLTVIRGFTKEAGLRTLERTIGTLCRKVARKIASGQHTKTLIKPELVETFLGPKMYQDEEVDQFNQVGVATGLAWTAAGGEILSIETTKMKGRGVTLTGKLGEVMKESAQAAMGYIRSHAQSLGIDERHFEESELHVHLPAAAIPKDGPSAGITLTTALVSLLTGKPIQWGLAMTGEVTLTGKVLAVGGIKEKILAAIRYNLKEVIIPAQNEKDLQDISPEHLKHIKVVLVRTIDEVLAHALLDFRWMGKTTEEHLGHQNNQHTLVVLKGGRKNLASVTKGTTSATGAGHHRGPVKRKRKRKGSTMDQVGRFQERRRIKEDSAA